MTDPIKELKNLLRPLGRRLRRYDAHRLVTRSLWLPLAVTASVLALARGIPFVHYAYIAWAPLALWFLGMGSYTLFKPLPPIQVAKTTDVTLGLHDRLATALALSTSSLKDETRFDPTLIARQQKDALDTARGIDPGTAFPLEWTWRPIALAALCLGIAITLSALPNPMDTVIAERTVVAEIAEAQAEALEELAQELADDDALDPEEREALLRQLREAAEALRRNPGDIEDALADIAKLEETLRHRLDPQNAAREAALSALASDLASLASQSDHEQNTAAEELARLLQALADEPADEPADENAAIATAETRAHLARALEEAAAHLSSADPSLASALSELAQSVKSDQLSSAEAEVSAALEALDATAAESALQEALAQALSQSHQASRSLAQATATQRSGQSAVGQARAGQAGQSSAVREGQQSAGQGQSGQAGQARGGQGQGQSQDQGDANNQGQDGQGQGQGQGHGQGTQGGSGGTTARTADPARRPGSPNDPTQPNQDYDVAMDDANTVFAPLQRGQPGDPDFVPGRQTGDGEETVRENMNPRPGTPSAALVPYTEVYASYSTAAVAAMDRAYIPAGLKAYVKTYFTNLEP